MGLSIIFIRWKAAFFYCCGIWKTFSWYGSGNVCFYSFVFQLRMCIQFKSVLIRRRIREFRFGWCEMGVPSYVAIGRSARKGFVVGVQYWTGNEL